MLVVMKLSWPLKSVWVKNDVAAPAIPLRPITSADVNTETASMSSNRSLSVVEALHGIDELVSILRVCGIEVQR